MCVVLARADDLPQPLILYMWVGLAKSKGLIKMGMCTCINKLL